MRCVLQDNHQSSMRGEETKNSLWFIYLFPIFPHASASLESHINISENIKVPDMQSHNCQLIKSTSAYNIINGVSHLEALADVLSVFFFYISHWKLHLKLDICRLESLFNFFVGLWTHCVWIQMHTLTYSWPGWCLKSVFTLSMRRGAMWFHAVSMSFHWSPRYLTHKQYSQLCPLQKSQSRTKHQNKSTTDPYIPSQL